MDQKQYSIARAADILGYKPHVIRYYEKEFNLKIPRNKYNHRYFTDNEICILKQIKELQERGYNNTQIKMILKSLEADRQIYAQVEGVAATAYDIYPPYNNEALRILIEDIIDNDKKEIIEEFKNQLEFANQTIIISITELAEAVYELAQNLGEISRNIQIPGNKKDESSNRTKCKEN